MTPRGHTFGAVKVNQHVDLLLFQIRALKLPEPQLELAFWPERKFRFDLAWPAQMLAVEVEGVMFGKDGHLRGRHVSITGFKADLVKYNEAVCLGWRLIRVTPGQVKSGDAVRWIERGLSTTPVTTEEVSRG